MLTYHIGNAAELEFALWAERDGWQVTKRGWPDFICRRGSEIMCVEVKCSDSLSQAQDAAARDLAARGIPVYVWHVQDRILKPVSEVQRIIAEQDISVALAAKILEDALSRSREECRKLDKKLRIRDATVGQLRSALAEREAEVQRLTDDIGYLLRRMHDRGGYENQVHRVKNLMRRHREALEWMEP